MASSAYSGTTIQPSLHPVMPKNLEKLEHTMASGSQASTDFTSEPSGSRSARSRYVSSTMRHAPRLRARSQTAFKVSNAMVVPVGFDGDVIITALVRSVQYSSHSSGVRWNRVEASVGTSTTLPPNARTSSRLHGYEGSAISTSSSSFTVSAADSSSAVEPPAVIAMRLGSTSTWWRSR